MVGRTKCLVKSCNNTHPIHRDCSWHQWPAQESAIHRWMIELRKNKAATGFSEHSLPDVEGQRICSDHFEKTCFKEGVLRRLKPTAVPTIFKLPTQKDPTSSTSLKQQTVESSSSRQNENTATPTSIAVIPTSLQQSPGVLQDRSDLAQQADHFNMGHQVGSSNNGPLKRIDVKCYVKGCKSGCDSCDESIHFFKPKDEKTVHLWQKFIGRNDLKLGKFHSVCHKHFDDADIIKETTTVQGENGQAAGDSTRWKLVGGAVPKFFLGNPASELRQFRKIAIRPTDLRSPAATPVVVLKPVVVPKPKVVPKIIVHNEAPMMPQTKQQDSIEIILPEKPPAVPQKTYSNRKKSQALAKSPILHSDNEANRDLDVSDNFTLKSALNPKETLIALPSSPAGNTAKLSQPARNSLVVKPNVPEDSSRCGKNVNQDKQLSLPNKTVQADVILSKQAILPSTWICQPGLLIRPNMPMDGDRPIGISAQQIQQFPVPYFVGRQTLLNPKEAVLPPSWSWQENYLPKKQSICSKFKWLEENNLFEFTKSVIVSEGVSANSVGNPTHTIRYFIRGRQVHHRNLNSQFSTINELAYYLKIYDEVPECVGYADKNLRENSLLSKFPNTGVNQSKSCLLLASERSNLCAFCFSLMTPTIQHRIVNYTNNLQPTDCIPPTTDSQDVIVCGNITPRSKEIVGNFPNGNAGIPVIAEEESISERSPDPEAVTVPVPSEFVGGTVEKWENLESVLIKRSSSVDSSSYPLFLYHLQTWCCGIYAPSEVSALPPVSTASDTPTLDEGQPIIHDWTSYSKPTFLISQPKRVYCRRKGTTARRIKEIWGATIKWTDVENLAYHSGKVHITLKLKGQPSLQNSLPRVFHDEVDSCDDDLDELNIKKNGRSPSCSSLSESEDSSVVRMDDDSDYSPSGSSNTDVEENESDDSDLELAERFLRTEILLKRRLQRKYLWYSRVLTRSKEIGRSILKASQEFEDKCRNGIIKQQIAKKTRPKKQCNECGKMIHAKGFQDHVKLHSGVKSHLCELCGRAFVLRSSLNSHIRLNHRGLPRTKPPKNFMCSTCGHTVSSKERLGIHERIHTDERPFDCKYCDKKFREKGTLVRHIRTHTGERPYACNICGNAYRSRFAYVSHHRTKHETNENEGRKDPTGDRRKHPKIGYRCEYCGKEFCQGRILAYEKHLTTHTGVSAAIPCPQSGCDFTYSDMAQLKKHTLAQHPEKAYTCDVCNKIFLMKQTLTDHRSMHDPTRGFQCSFCPVKLTVKASLIAHEKLHTRETPHECSFCEMRFHSTYLLQIHMRTHQPSQLKRKRYRKPVEK